MPSPFGSALVESAPGQLHPFPGDGDVFRAQVDIGLMVRSWDEVVEQEPDLVARVLAADEPEAPPMGPTRPELLELLHA